MDWTAAEAEVTAILPTLVGFWGAVVTIMAVVAVASVVVWAMNRGNG